MDTDRPPPPHNTPDAKRGAPRGLDTANDRDPNRRPTPEEALERLSRVMWKEAEWMAANDIDIEHFERIRASHVAQRPAPCKEGDAG